MDERKVNRERATRTRDDDRPRFDPERDREWRERYDKGLRDAMRRYQARGDERNPHYTPWLLIRYAQGDLGLRPLPTGTNFWSSPDIWIESSDPYGNAVAGEENSVWVRIFNLGMAPAAPVQVDFYWANPALGLGAATMNHIGAATPGTEDSGTAWVDIPSQTELAVRCPKPWIPEYLNDGHECLMVNCTNVIMDRITAPFSPTIDRHVGQRNVHVEKVAAGKRLGFRLELNNFLPFSAATVVMARATHLRTTAVQREGLSRRDLVNRLIGIDGWVPGPTEMLGLLDPTSQAYRAARASKAWVETGETQRTSIRKVDSSPRIDAAVGETNARILSSHPRRQAAELLMARDSIVGGRLVQARNALRLLEFKMEGLESRKLHLDLEVPAGAQRGEHLVFTFEQMAEDISLGGYTVVIEVVD